VPKVPGLCHTATQDDASLAPFCRHSATCGYNSRGLTISHTDALSFSGSELSEWRAVEPAGLRRTFLEAIPVTMSESTFARPEKSNPFLEIFINVVIPTLILSYLSKEQYLGTKLALIVALAFPIVYGCKDFIGAHKINFFSILGVVTVALTGGMGLLEIDPKYIAIKEAAVPGLIGLATLFSLKTRFPLVKTFIYNDKLLQVDKIDRALRANNTVNDFEKSLANSSILLACSFFVASATNYALAKIVLVSPPGTEAFNVELARMMALSYPVNVVPAMIVMLFAVFYLFRSIRKYTNLSMEEIFAGAQSEQ
jgi:hypothetical protein